MKIQIDTDNNILTIEDSVNLGDFIEFLNKLFPNEEWRKFKLEVKVIQNWTNPIIIEREKPSWSNTQPWITYSGHDKFDYDNERIKSKTLLNFKVND